MGFELKWRGNMHTGCSGLNHQNFYLGPFFCSRTRAALDWLGFAIPFPTLFPGFGCCVYLLWCS